MDNESKIGIMDDSFDFSGENIGLSNKIVTSPAPEITPQKTYERPFLLYEQTDMGPYHVYVENSTKDVGKLNPVKVGELILKSLPEVRIIFKNSMAANNLIKAKNVRADRKNSAGAPSGTRR